MDAPVDLTNLRSMTDGDKDLEKELFKEFYSAFDAGLNLLQVSTGDGAVETWRGQSHALKGVALNLGAEKLGALCKKAQESQTASEKAKVAMLENIRAEYKWVKEFLLKTSEG